jgi:hypothetical protein
MALPREVLKAVERLRAQRLAELAKDAERKARAERSAAFKASKDPGEEPA